MPLIKLKKPRRDHTRDGRMSQLNYEEGAPFFENPRGILIHRVKSIYRLTATWTDEPWWIIQYWCENSGRTDASDNGLIFDPGEKLICARCEGLAIAKGEKTSSELAGRHVCTGVCRPVNVCCDKNVN